MSRHPFLPALAWLTGGALWALAGLWGDGTWAPLWVTAHLVLLLALLTTARLDLHGGSKIGWAGLVIAGVARSGFVVAEIPSAVQDALLPVCALLTAVGMTLYGVSVLRARRWSGPGRFSPLAAGLYPFVVMFPLLAASGGEPSASAIAGWGVVLGAIGAALWRLPHESAQQEPGRMGAVPIE